MTPDPKVFSWQSPYCSMDCNPVGVTDVLGDEGEEPEGNTTDYTVKKGDTAYSLGGGTNKGLAKLKELNPGFDWEGRTQGTKVTLYPGDKLKIPNTSPMTPKGLLEEPSAIDMTLKAIEQAVVDGYNKSKEWLGNFDFDIEQYGFTFWSENATGSGYSGGISTGSIDYTGVDDAFSGQAGDKPEGFEQSIIALTNAISGFVQTINDMIDDNDDSVTNISDQGEKPVIETTPSDSDIKQSVSVIQKEVMNSEKTELTTESLNDTINKWFYDTDCKGTKTLVDLDIAGGDSIWSFKRTDAYGNEKFNYKTRKDSLTEKYKDTQF